VFYNFFRLCGAAVVASGLTACATVDAPTHSEDVAALSAQAMALYQEGLTFMTVEEDQDALAVFIALADDYPDHAGPLINLGILYRRNDDPDAAMTMLKRAIEIYPDCAPAYNELGIVMRQQGRFDEAESAYLKAIDVNPDYALAFLNLGVLYDLYQRRFADAIQNYEQYLEISGDESTNAQVEKWVVDLRRRVAQFERVADAQRVSS